MRTLPIMLALGLGLAPAAPAAADAGSTLRTGKGAGTGTALDELAPESGAVRQPRQGTPNAPPDSDATKRNRPADTGRDRDDRRDRRDRRKRRPFFPGLLHHHHDDDDDDRIIVVPVPTPAPDPPAAETVAPPPPPDPRGPAISRARGAAAEPPFRVGEPLPPDVPHVALAWRSYGLSEPPPGLTYARVGRTVLLIDPVTRVVERVVGADELAPREG